MLMSAGSFGCDLRMTPQSPATIHHTAGSQLLNRSTGLRHETDCSEHVLRIKSSSLTRLAVDARDAFVREPFGHRVAPERHDHQWIERVGLRVQIWLAGGDLVG